MKVWICDDEPEDVYRFKKVLQEIGSKHGIQIEFTIYESGEKLLFDVEDAKGMPDVIYLDINMPKKNGVEVAELLRQNKYRNEIIFLTSSEKYMLNGFDVGALHYVVKNKTPTEKFEKIFLMAYQSVSAREEELVSFSCAGEECSVPLKLIRYFEVCHRVITVYFGKQSFEFYSPLDKVENMLCCKGFARVHRSYVVALEYIDRKTYEEIRLKDGTKVLLGRKYVKQFSEIWESFLGEQSA